VEGLGTNTHFDDAYSLSGIVEAVSSGGQALSGSTDPQAPVWKRVNCANPLRGKWNLSTPEARAELNYDRFGVGECRRSAFVSVSPPNQSGDVTLR
jgi:hypothetical protein